MSESSNNITPVIPQPVGISRCRWRAEYRTGYSWRNSSGCGGNIRRNCRAGRWLSPGWIWVQQQTHGQPVS